MPSQSAVKPALSPLIGSRRIRTSPYLLPAPLPTTILISYMWVLTCPSQPALVFYGAAPSITTGPGGNINTLGVTLPYVCGLTLNTTSNGVTYSSSTTITSEFTLGLSSN
jgi:hypothetical protein